MLRTSVLLSLSNKMMDKMMDDLITRSRIDTSTGEAWSVPLPDVEVTLPQVTVVASTWSAWREQHPKAPLLGEDARIGQFHRSTEVWTPEVAR